MEGLQRYYEHVVNKFNTLHHCKPDRLCEKIKDPEEGVAFILHDETSQERFQRLMQSHNTVFKTTIFQKWHDEFLIPWVHYVPVTMGIKELPETSRFFVETKKRQEIGKAIAEDGRNCAQRARSGRRDRWT